MTIGYCEVCREGGLVIVNRCCANCRQLQREQTGNDTADSIKKGADDS